MLLSDAIDRYLADRRAKGYAPATVRSHKTYLKMFLADTGNIQTNNVTPRHLDSFWSKHADWSAGNFNKVKAVLSTFFEWCRQRSHLPRGADPLEGVRKRKVEQRQRTIVEPDMFDVVLDAAANPRDRALVALSLYLFTRISETTTLRWGDIDGKDGTIQVFRHKTATTDTLPVCLELERELHRWRMAYSAMLEQKVEPGWFVVPAYSKPVFLGTRGGTNRKVPVYQSEPILVPNRQLKDGTYRIQLALERAGYTDLEGEGGHTLRRSGATALYNELSDRGHDRAIRMCQAMLGHAHIQTTEIYLRLDLDRKARNDLLAGKAMFASRANLAQVIPLSDGVVHGSENG